MRKAEAEALKLIRAQQSALMRLAEHLLNVREMNSQDINSFARDAIREGNSFKDQVPSASCSSRGASSSATT